MLFSVFQGVSKVDFLVILGSLVELEGVVSFFSIALIIFALFATRFSNGLKYVTTFIETAKVLIISHITNNYLTAGLITLDF